MIDSVTKDALHREWQHCVLKQSQEPAPFHPYTIPDECGVMAVVAKAAGAGLLPHGYAPNVYDMTTWDPYNVINLENTTIHNFFNTPEIRKALNVPDDFEGRWMGCIPGAGRRRRLERNHNEVDQLHLLDHDRPASMHKYVENLLDDAKIPVLVYNGDRDATCNAVGSELFLDGLQEWSGAALWKDATKYNRGLWLPAEEDEGQIIGGYAKEVQNLKFVVVYNSGHLVPYNRPAAGLDLITRLLAGQSYVDETIAPILVDVAPPQDAHDGGPRKNPNHPHNWSGTLVAMVVAFLGGYFVSHWQKTAGGYQSVPSVS